MPTNKPEVVLPEAPPIPAHLFDKDQSIVWAAAWETLRKHVADTLTPPPAIDIRKLRELVARWRADKADDAHSISVWDQGYAHGRNECSDELAALIGDNNAP